MSTQKPTSDVAKEIIAALHRKIELLGPCVEFDGKLNNNGYGPHRQVYIKAYGKPPPGYDVTHLCHNRSCINLAHLTIGTRSENMEMNRHRPKRPSLTDKEVQAIRDLRATGRYTQREIAELLGLNGSTVCKVLLGMTYRDT